MYGAGWVIVMWFVFQARYVYFPNVLEVCTYRLHSIWCAKLLGVLLWGDVRVVVLSSI